MGELSRGADVNRHFQNISIGFFLLFGIVIRPACCVCVADMEAVAGRHYSTRHGLPSNHIEDIEQDQKGRIILSTQHGFSIFDGQEFLNVIDLPEGLDTYLRCTAIDKRGAIWLGTLNGLGLYESGNIRRTHLTIPGKRHDITDMVIDSEGVLWFICNSRGPYCIQGGKLFSFADHPLFEAGLVRDLEIDLDGRLWCATSRGICYRSADDFIRFDLDGRDLKNVVKIEPRSIHHGWMAFRDGRILEYDQGTYQEQRLVGRNEVLTFFDLKAGRKQGVWAATSKGL